MPVWRTQVQVTHPSMPGPGYNTFHMRTSNDVVPEEGADDLETLLTALETFFVFAATIYPGGTVHSADGEFRRVDGNEEQTVSVDGWTQTRSGTAAPLPPANTLCVTWRTTSPTRSGRGRTFLGPVAVGALQSNGSPTEAIRSEINQYGNALIATSQGLGNGALVVWSPSKQLARDITSLTVPNEFAVLRSRRD